MNKIRNFCIVAHIDHGKSTLADRMLEATGTVENRKMKAQYLDQLELERERGITIKMAPVRMKYKDYILNLIDTPGHSDFGYEVSRALLAVEGAILLVDATQGVQAQTLANLVLAQKAGLKIIGAVNKIDMKPVGLEKVIEDTARLLGVSSEKIYRVSGKTGEGVGELLESVVREIPEPAEDEGKLQALIFDSHYDEHKGDIAYIRLFGGQLKAGETIEMAATGVTAKVKEVGIFAPELKVIGELKSGESGYVATGIKNPESIKIGDTMRSGMAGRTKADVLPGFKEPKPVVFVAIYPTGDSDYDDLKSALARLRMNDSALYFEPDRSEVLGRGFKCGFLGRLHFEIITERLDREFGLEIVTSFPSVAYTVEVAGVKQVVYSPKDFPDYYDKVWQPMVKLEVITPPDYVNSVLQLSRVFHLSEIETKNFGENMIINIKMPLSDLVRDFDDKIKSLTEGFASFSYEIIEEELGEVDKLEILVASEVVSGLTRVVARDELESEGRAMAEKLKNLLPKQQFPQAIQAVARGRVIARETISAMRKDVTGYLYGGDRTRKMKLWKKQQRGKKRLKERGQGTVDIPPSVFRELLKK